MAGDVPLNIAGQSSIVVPVLQKADGTFIGATYGPDTNGSWQYAIVAFDAGANVKWTKTGGAYSWPYMATADGNVLVDSQASATDPVMLLTLDSNGNETVRVPEDWSLLSWTGNSYRYGSIVSFQSVLPVLAASYAAIVGGDCPELR
ncbi:MAG: hypothetical protein LAN64_07165 [Acidobacteriia bacterium]|nr:hypothetical protein [Terriglobia bacterium]